VNTVPFFEEPIADAGQLPFNRIGVVYCTSSQTAKGRECEKLADCEVVEVAHAAQGVLQARGYQVQLVDLNPGRMPELREYDWIINLTETIYGFPFADYEIAQQMEFLGIHFTGSGSHALKSCLDKAVTKARLMKYGILTPRYDVFYPGEEAQTKCRYPVIVKPVHEDGSIGITGDSIAWNAAELTPRIEKIHAVYHQAALVEEFIEGRDITASILGNGENAVVFPLSEITYTKHSPSKFLTFEAKWLSESTDFQTAVAQCPCSVDPLVETAIAQTALQAYHIMGCRDYARVDFRLMGDIPYVLEVNPNPCINPDDSGFVRCGKAAGISYADLIHQILLCSVGKNRKPPEWTPCELFNGSVMAE
jgi:D-alanine-D-alanine ligase